MASERYIWMRRDIHTGDYQISTEEPTNAEYWFKYVLATFAREVAKEAQARGNGETQPAAEGDIFCAFTDCDDIGTLSRGTKGATRFYCNAHFWT